MKKSNFTLKTLGSEIAIFFNGKPLKKISNFKKALRFIAFYIAQKNIDNFELLVWEKGTLHKIQDFDPEVMINHSEGKINTKRNGQTDFSEFMQEDNDFRDDNMDRSRDNSRSRDNRENRNRNRGESDGLRDFMRRMNVNGNNRNNMNRNDDSNFDDDDFRFDGDDDDDFDFDDFRNRRFGDDDFQRRRTPQWTYKPVDTSQEEEKIKKNMRNIFSRF